MSGVKASPADGLSAETKELISKYVRLLSHYLSQLVLMISRLGMDINETKEEEPELEDEIKVGLPLFLL